MPAKKKTKKRKEQKRPLFKLTPELRGDHEHVVVFYSPCCGASMRSMPVFRPGKAPEYRRTLRCRRCHWAWNVELLFTKRGYVRSVHLTA